MLFLTVYLLRQVGILVFRVAEPGGWTCLYSELFLFEEKGRKKERKEREDMYACAIVTLMRKN